MGVSCQGVFIEKLEACMQLEIVTSSYMEGDYYCRKVKENYLPMVYQTPTYLRFNKTTGYFKITCSCPYIPSKYIWEYNWI